MNGGMIEMSQDGRKLTEFEIHELEKDINSNESPGRGKFLATGCQVTSTTRLIDDIHDL